MRQRIILPILLLTVVLGTSCVSQSRIEHNYSELRPDIVRLYMTMDDYQYLGDVTIDVEYKTYLGMFRKILTVNGEPYDPRFYRETNISFTHFVKLGPLNKALYKVADTYPNADYLMPASSSDNIEHMFGGRIHHRSMTIKVYAVNKTSAAAIEKQHKAEVEELNSQNAALNEQVEALRKELQTTKSELERTQQELRARSQTSSSKSQTNSRSRR